MQLGGGTASLSPFQRSPSMFEHDRIKLVEAALTQTSGWKGEGYRAELRRRREGR
jgi:hypothetical protein